MPEEREPSKEEIEKRVRNLLGNGQDGEQKDDLESRFAEIEERAKSIRASSPLPEPPEFEIKRPQAPKYQGGNYYRGVGVGFAIVYAFVGPIMVGAGIGWFITNRTGNQNGLVWGGAIGIVAGFIGRIVTVIQTTKTGPKE